MPALTGFPLLPVLPVPHPGSSPPDWAGKPAMVLVVTRLERARLNDCA